MLCASSGEYSETVITCSIVTGINVHSVIWFIRLPEPLESASCDLALKPVIYNTFHNVESIS